jgi:hypothetical protein
MVRRGAAPTLCLVTALVLGASACGTSSLDRPAPPAPSIQAIDGNINQANESALSGEITQSHLPAGVSLLPIRVPTFVFGPEVAAEPVQSASLALAGLVPKDPRLHVVALPSPVKVAAVDLLEDSTPRLKWGQLLTPALRTIFRAFAADPSSGDWLVIVDDVNVVGGVDPVPMTAYLWPRAALTDYARCGIPDTGIDRCTDAFYVKAFMVLVTAGTSGIVR